MITCSICGLQNDELAVLCSSCKSYLQSKVDTLNLFETIWQLIENPGAAFKKIVLARHKNYVLVLSCLVGISTSFALFWMMHLGNRFDNLLVLTSAGAMVGLPLGLVIVLLVSVCISVEIRLFRGKVSLRDSRAVVSYAGIPVVMSLVMIFPLEIAIFGVDFFGTNPPPMVIDPGVYLALVGFDGLAVLWSIFLLYKGIRVASGFRLVRSMAVTGTVVLLMTAVFLGIQAVAGPHT